MFYLLMFVGLTLSAAAAYFSVTGLAAIFAGAFYSVVIMGSALEATKLVIASWLYRRWEQINRLMKTYLIVATVVLMLITSLGIFGYLSQAHLEQDAPNAQLQNQIVLIEQRIDQETKNIERSTKALNQLDAQIDRYVELGAVSKSTQVRKQQQEERTLLKESIDSSIKQIDTLNVELVPLKNQTALVEAKVGPLKYFAKMVQGEDVDLDKAVQMVILLLIFVFDPLAVMTLIAANKEQMLRAKEKEENKEKEQKTQKNVELKQRVTEEIFEKNDPSVGLPTREEKNSNKGEELQLEIEETPSETKTYQEKENFFTSIKNKSKIVESKISDFDDQSIENEESDESLYRFRHRKQQPEEPKGSDS